MAIQMRRGNDADYNAAKMVAGEVGVSVDKRKVYVAFAPRDSAEMAKQSSVDAVNSKVIKLNVTGETAEIVWEKS